MYVVKEWYCEKVYGDSLSKYSIGYYEQCHDKVTLAAEWDLLVVVVQRQRVRLAGQNVSVFALLERLLKTFQVTPPTPFAEPVVFCVIS